MLLCFEVYTHLKREELLFLPRKMVFLAQFQFVHIFNEYFQSKIINIFTGIYSPHIALRFLNYSLVFEICDLLETVLNWKFQPFIMNSSSKILIG